MPVATQRGDVVDELVDALVALGPVYAAETVNEWLDEERCTRADAVATLRCLAAHDARKATLLVAPAWANLRAGKERDAAGWARAADGVAGFDVEELSAAAE